MKGASRPRLLESTVTAKHTADERMHVQAAAQAAGLTVSEWSRQTHLQALEAPSWSLVLLREMMALRKIVIALYRDLCRGQSPSQDRLREIVDNAETTKASMAQSRIHANAIRSKEVDQNDW